MHSSLKRKTILVLVIIVISVALVGTLKLVVDTSANFRIEPNDVEWITMRGGLPGFGSKVLFPSRDTETMKEIVQLVNSSPMTSYATGKNYVTRFLVDWVHKLENEQVYPFGHPIYLTIKLKDSRTIQLSTLSKIQSRKLPNGGVEVTGAPSMTGL